MSRTNIVGGITYGQILHGAVAHNGWWVLPQHRYINVEDAAVVESEPIVEVKSKFNFHPVSQRNPTWREHLLGFSHDPRVTIGRHGSWLLVMTMLANAAQDVWLDPIKLNQLRKQSGGFYVAGPLGGFPTHFRIEKETNGRVRLLQILRRKGDKCDAELLTALKTHIARGQPAMIEVDPTYAVSQLEGGNASSSRRSLIPPEILDAPTHFVLAVEFDETREALIMPSGKPRTFVHASELGQPVVELKIIDPWDGHAKSLCPTYGPDIASAIVRVMFFEINRDTALKKTPTLAPIPALQIPSLIGLGNLPANKPNDVTQNEQTAITPPGNTHLPAPPAPILGVNTMWNGSAAMDAFNRGCRLFTCVNDSAMIKPLSDLGAMVMARWLWSDTIPTQDWYFKHLGGNLSRVIYLGLDVNESNSDQPNEIAERAKFDVAMATAIRERSLGKARYAAGSFAFQHPNYDDPKVCKAIRDGYAEAYNRGLILFNVHSEVSAWQGDGSAWDERSLTNTLRRWEFLFKRCGFDPNVRGVVSERTGLNMSSGGFFNQGVGNDSFITFCRRWHEVQSRPLVISAQDDALVLQGHVPASVHVGVWHSPFIGGTLFQLGNQGRQDWAKFNLEYYLNDLGNYVWNRDASKMALDVLHAELKSK
ncbi:MAG: hypothetical protein KIH69_022100 [Anaerolineae bacterium]|nr:hypothetical protein [Anaerolineae bacterium]